MSEPIPVPRELLGRLAIYAYFAQAGASPHLKEQAFKDGQDAEALLSPAPADTGAADQQPDQYNPS